MKIIRLCLVLVLGFAFNGFSQSPSGSSDGFQGLVGVYGPEMDGKKVASGLMYKSSGATAAHATLPFGTKLRVTNFANGKSVLVVVNDRLPSGQGRVLKISSSAAQSLGFLKEGVAYAKVDVVGREEMGSPQNAPTENSKVDANMDDDKMSAKIEDNAPVDQSPEEEEPKMPSPKKEEMTPVEEPSEAEKDTKAVKQINPADSTIKNKGQAVNVNRIFVIQFAAFSKKEKAIQYQEELAKQGIKTYYAKEGQAGSELYKVRESTIYRDIKDVFTKVLEYKKQGLDCFAVGKFFVANA